MQPLELALVGLPLLVALALRPWRLLQGRPALLTPLLATLVVLPWLWALPSLHAAPLQLRWSGAGLVLLMLGWPLAMPVLAAVGATAWALSPMPAAEVLAVTAWQGAVPATLGLGVGALTRRFLPHNPFVYLFGRAFAGTLVCLFLAHAAQQQLGQALPYVGSELDLVGRWLMAWGDATVTGMLCAVFVGYRPQWLLTWADTLYLRRH